MTKTPHDHRPHGDGRIREGDELPTSNQKLSCPFCGDRDIRAHHRGHPTAGEWVIECHSCSCELTGFASEQDAWKTWNGRWNPTPVETREQRTRQPLADSKLTVEVALREADRCWQYPDPVLNEQVIVVLANEVLRLRSVEPSAPRCEAQSPGTHTSKRCDLPQGHEGPHVATEGRVTDKWQAEKASGERCSKHGNAAATCERCLDSM